VSRPANHVAARLVVSPLVDVDSMPFIWMLSPTRVSASTAVTMLRAPGRDAPGDESGASSRMAANAPTRVAPERNRLPRSTPKVAAALPPLSA
jgi:hypothetical protein